MNLCGAAWKKKNSELRWNIVRIACLPAGGREGGLRKRTEERRGVRKECSGSSTAWRGAGRRAGGQRNLGKRSRHRHEWMIECMLGVGLTGKGHIR